MNNIGQDPIFGGEYMSNYLFKAIIAGFFVLLSGCQTSGPSRATGQMNNNFFGSYPAPENNLAQSVQQALLRSNDPVLAQINVKTSQNIVILSGYVKKIRQSDVAEQISRKVPGVQTVENHLIVRQ